MNCSGNPLNYKALNWRSPEAVSGTITLDCENRAVGNFLLDDPGTVDLVFANMLAGGIYRFAVKGTATTAILTLPAASYFVDGAVINITFTTEAWSVYEFTLQGSTTVITKVGTPGTSAGLSASVSDTSSTAYTLSESDTGKVLNFTAAGAISIGLPKTLPVGFSVGFIQAGSGQITFTPAVGSTLNNRSAHNKSAGQYGTCTLIINSNVDDESAVYILSGDTAA